jgi:hypothetical protein
MHLTGQEKREVPRMSGTFDEGVQRQPGHRAPATGAQGTEDAAHDTGTRLPGPGDALGPGRGGPASEPFTDVLALRSGPGTRARLLVTACGDEPGTVLDEALNPLRGWPPRCAPSAKRDAMHHRSPASASTGRRE